MYEYIRDELKHAYGIRHVYTYVYIIYMPACVCMLAYIRRVCARMHVCVCVCVCLYANVCVYVFIYIVRVSVYIYIYIYIYICMYVYMYIYIYIYMRTSASRVDIMHTAHTFKYTHAYEDNFHVCRSMHSNKKF